MKLENKYLFTFLPNPCQNPYQFLTNDQEWRKAILNSESIVIDSELRKKKQRNNTTDYFIIED